jgi:hypothetical protein
MPPDPEKTPMPIICEIIPKRSANFDQLKRLGNGLKQWVDEDLDPRGLAGQWTRAGLEDLLGGELPTPGGIIIANCARSLLGQANLDAAIRAYLMRLAEQDWDAVDMDPVVMERRVVCGVIAPASDEEDSVPDPDTLRDAFRRLQERLPADAVQSVRIKVVEAGPADYVAQRARELDLDLGEADEA